MPGKAFICLSILSIVWSGPAFASCPPVWKPADQMSESDGAAPPASPIYAFARYNGDLFAARARSLTRWDGAGWQELVTWDSGEIHELLEYKGALIAGGDFITDDGAHYYIAGWNGQGWLPLGSGTDQPVSALAEYHGDLIAAGAFLSAGDTPCGHVARWDGHAWHPLGAGIDRPVRDLLVFNDQLLAAGESGIHQWNGAGWTSLSILEMDCLAAYNHQLLAGGSSGLYRRTADGEWLPFFSWPGGRVGFVATYNDTLVVACDEHGGTPPECIYHWRDDSWWTLGRADAQVRALITHHGELFAGGDFTTMSFEPVDFCVRHGPAGLSILQGPQQVVVFPGDSATLSVVASDASGGLTYVWRRNGFATTMCAGNVNGCTSHTLTLNPALPQHAGTWDVAVSDGDCTLISNAVTLTVLPDSAPPSVVITSPSPHGSHSTSSLNINLAGTALDNVAVTSITWVNDRGGSGTCTGTTNWAAQGIPLEPGQNAITITARDAAGNEASATQIIIRSCPRWYADADGDGYGNADVWVEECLPPAGYLLDNTDCNDADATIHPGAIEMPGDGIDQDCDGADLPDADRDGVADGADQCPNTPEGVAVDAQGCPLSQDPTVPPEADTDGDGVVDGLDGCPDDPAKTEPGSCGCGRPDTPGCSRPAPRGLCGVGMVGATACSMVVMGLGLIRRKGWTG